MKGVSLVLFAVLGLAAPTRAAAAQSKSAVSSGAPTRISDAEVIKDGTVQIRFNNGRSNVDPHLLIRLVKFARLPLRFHFSNDLLEDFHRFQTAFAFVAFDVQLHASVWRYRDFKFALGHKSSRLTSMNHCMSLPPKF